MGFAKPDDPAARMGICTACGKREDLREGYCILCAPLDVVGRAIGAEFFPGCTVTIERTEAPEMEGYQSFGIHLHVVGETTEERRKLALEAIVKILGAQNCPCPVCGTRRAKPNHA